MYPCNNNNLLPTIPSQLRKPNLRRRLALITRKRTPVPPFDRIQPQHIPRQCRILETRIHHIPYTLLQLHPMPVSKLGSFDGKIIDQHITLIPNRSKIAQLRRGLPFLHAQLVPPQRIALGWVLIPIPRVDIPSQLFPPLTHLDVRQSQIDPSVGLEVILPKIPWNRFIPQLLSVR